VIGLEPEHQDDWPETIAHRIDEVTDWRSRMAMDENSHTRR